MSRTKANYKTCLRIRKLYGAKKRRKVERECWSLEALVAQFGLSKQTVWRIIDMDPIELELRRVREDECRRRKRANRR